MSLRIAVSAFAHRSVRRRHALELGAYSAGLVVLLVLVASWIVAQALAAPPVYWPKGMTPPPPTPWSTVALADVFALCLVAFALFVLAPAQVAATVAAERRSGTLDQLRTTPLDPLHLLGGLTLGAPARLYLLCAGPLLFHVACGLTGVIALDTLCATLAVLLVGAIFSALLAAVIALAPMKETGGAFVALAVASVLGLAGFISASLACDPSASAWAFLHPAGALNAAMLSHEGLWRHLFVSEWRFEVFSRPGYLGHLSFSPLFAVLFSLAAGVMLARAACRRLAAPHRSLLSKPQAVALFALASAALILPIDAREHSLFYARDLPLVLGLLLLPVLATLALCATPSFEAWALALRRGLRPRAWEDDGHPLGASAVMVGLYFALVTLTLFRAGFPSSLAGVNWLALLWAAATALSLPLFALFATTRFQTQATRSAFGVAIGAHFIVQIIAIGMLSSGSFAFVDRTWIEFGALSGLVVPAWVIFRQRALRRRTLIGA